MNGKYNFNIYDLIKFIQYLNIADFATEAIFHPHNKTENDPKERKPPETANALRRTGVQINRKVIKVVADVVVQSGSTRADRAQYAAASSTTQIKMADIHCDRHRWWGVPV